MIAVSLELLLLLNSWDYLASEEDPSWDEFSTIFTAYDLQLHLGLPPFGLYLVSLQLLSSDPASWKDSADLYCFFPTLRDTLRYLPLNLFIRTHMYNIHPYTSCLTQALCNEQWVVLLVIHSHRESAAWKEEQELAQEITLRGLLRAKLPFQNFTLTSDPHIHLQHAATNSFVLGSAF